MRNQHTLKYLIIACTLIMALTVPGLALAQDGGNHLCVHAPESIARGDTDAIEIEIDLAGVPTPNGDDWVCATIGEIFEVMGVGIAGVRINNFEIDPPDIRSSAQLQTASSNQWTWSINAIGDENTRHNLIVYAYVDDDTRSSGYRSVARVPVRVEIKEAAGSTFDQIIRFLDGIKEILIILSAVIVAAISMRGQISQLLGRKSQNNNAQDEG